MLQQDLAHGLVYVVFYKADGTLIAVTLPADALEATPPDPWNDIVRGADAFGAPEQAERFYNYSYANTSLPELVHFLKDVEARILLPCL